MKIACLQFAPQVGDVDNNLNRADAILNRAKAADLEDLDLLVLPELAFSGYNFSSLQHIAPFLEPPGSGISSLWARTTALKYDCSVIVGYPEKVDVSVKWPASPEYYNSALVVNGDGDTIANYRKCFLYYTDETWALEGKDGFFRGEIPRVGDVAMGVCMDLNPYRFEAEWDAFEFGFHALDSEANVIILTMAWTTEQDPRLFSRRPQDPDLDTLVYWVQRLEPLIRADREGEVIVVFCNRCGSEDDVTYAGTSAVLGILQGEVYVYGVLGRGVKDLLVVDTDNLPPSKLTDAASIDAQRKSYDVDVAEYLELDKGAVEGDQDQEPDAEPQPASHQESEMPQISATQQLEDDDCAIISDEEDDDGGDYLSPLPSGAVPPQQPPLFTGRMSSLRTQLRLVIPTAPAISDPTPIEIDSAIPDTVIDDDDIIIDSPGVTSPRSPVQYPTRPKLIIPASPWRFRKKPGPYPRHLQSDGPQPQVFGGGKVCMTPITPFDTGSPIVWAKSGPMSAAERPAQTVSSIIPEAIPEDDVQDVTVDSSSKKPSSGHSSRRTSRQPSREREYNGMVALDSPQKLKYWESKQLVAARVPEPRFDDTGVGETLQEQSENAGAEEDTAHHPASPAEEKDSENKSPIPDLGAISAILETLLRAEGCTLASSHEQQPPSPSVAASDVSPSPCPDRPYSPKFLNASRNQSRSRLMHLREEHSRTRDPASDERVTSLSRGTIVISASPGVFDRDTGAYYYRPQSIPIGASPSLFSSVSTDTLNPSPADPVGRPLSRMDHRRKGSNSKSRTAIRAVSVPAMQDEEMHTPASSSRSASLAGTGHKSGGHGRRSSLRITTTNLDEQASRVISRESESSREGSRRRSLSRRRDTASTGTGTNKSGKRHRSRRNITRGRQPGARGTSVDRSDSVGETRSQAALSRRQSLHRQSRPDLSEMPTPSTPSTEAKQLEPRTRTVSGSRRSRRHLRHSRHRSAGPAPLFLKDTSATKLEDNMPGSCHGVGGETSTEIDNDTEIESDDHLAGESDENDDVLVGTVKRIAPDCPHHSPFRTILRHITRHQQLPSTRNNYLEEVKDNLVPVPPPPPLPPVSGVISAATEAATASNHALSSSLPSYAVARGASSAGLGAWMGRWTPLLSASSAEGVFSSTFSENSPMSPDPETPRFFAMGEPDGHGHEAVTGSLAVNSSKLMVLSEMVSSSTVTSPTYSEQLHIQMEMATGKTDGQVLGPVRGPMAVVDGLVGDAVESKERIVLGEDASAEVMSVNPADESKGEEIPSHTVQEGKDRGC